MDVKIGKRTWDPLAGPEKKAAEESKYAESKGAYGFCITGFQVYSLETGQPVKYGKEYGKKLDAKMVIDGKPIFRCNNYYSKSYKTAKEDNNVVKLFSTKNILKRQGA